MEKDICPKEDIQKTLSSNHKDKPYSSETNIFLPWTTITVSLVSFHLKVQSVVPQYLSQQRKVLLRDIAFSISAAYQMRVLYLNPSMHE